MKTPDTQLARSLETVNRSLDRIGDRRVGLAKAADGAPKLAAFDEALATLQRAKTALIRRALSAGDVTALAKLDDADLAGLSEVDREAINRALATATIAKMIR